MFPQPQAENGFLDGRRVESPFDLPPVERGVRCKAIKARSAIVEGDTGREPLLPVTRQGDLSENQIADRARLRLQLGARSISALLSRTLSRTSLMYSSRAMAISSMNRSAA